MSVYFMQFGPGGPIKIGCAVNVTKRRAIFQTAVAFPIEVLAIIDGGREREVGLHRQFSHLKIRGELFKPEEELMAHIRKLPPQPPAPKGKGAGRPQINFEFMSARFPAGTFDRMDAVLEDGEKRADLIREAVEKEVKRRERKH